MLVSGTLLTISVAIMLILSMEESWMPSAIRKHLIICLWRNVLPRKVIWLLTMDLWFISPMKLHLSHRRMWQSIRIAKKFVWLCLKVEKNMSIKKIRIIKVCLLRSSLLRMFIILWNGKQWRVPESRMTPIYWLKVWLVGKLLSVINAILPDKPIIWLFVWITRMSLWKPMVPI